MKKDIENALKRWRALHNNRLKCNPSSIAGWSNQLPDEQKLALIKKQIGIDCFWISAHQDFLNR